MVKMNVPLGCKRLQSTGRLCSHKKSLELFTRMSIWGETVVIMMYISVVLLLNVDVI